MPAMIIVEMETAGTVVAVRATTWRTVKKNAKG
jgi:hypothetical protein